MKKLVVGCGYLGQRVAAVWRNQGNEVYVLTRSEQRADQLRQLGFSPIVADITDESSLSELRQFGQVSTVLFAVGFDRTSGLSIREVYVDGLRNTLDALSTTEIQRFVYISSTGVYGQLDNSWVDEASPCEPVREGGRACLEAEKVLERHSTIGEKRIILRLAGIYGPNRVPRLDDLVRGTPLQVNAAAYLNLIHVDDACRIVVAAEANEPPNLFVVADGNPVSRRDFYQHAANLLGVGVEFMPVPNDAKERHLQSGGKRCRVTKLQSEVEYESQYPTYREGLADVLQQR